MQPAFILHFKTFNATSSLSQTPKSLLSFPISVRAFGTESMKRSWEHNKYHPVLLLCDLKTHGLCGSRWRIAIFLEVSHQVGAYRL